MDSIRRIVDLGLTESLTDSEKRGVRVLNIINSLTLILILFMAIVVNFLGLSIFNVLFALFSLVVMGIPLIFNYFHKTIQSRVFFVLLSYVMILVSSIIYGGDLHFQYFILVGISLPLILFDKEIGNYKWLLVFIAMPQGLYQEFHFIMFKPIVELSEYGVFWIRLSNDIILFLTIVVILLVFTTQNYKQYRKIEKSNLKLKQNNLELNQFAHIISHDLKVPLRRINSLTDIIIADYQDSFDEELNSNFELIKSSVKKMDQLIISVLEYSKAGRDSLDITTFYSQDLFIDVLSILEIPEGLNIILPSYNLSFIGSYPQIHQVFVNLIGNAVKYHNKLDGFVKITMTPTKKNLVEFKIEDNGPGIQNHFHDKLLQIFQTANESFRDDCSGIGLAIVKKLVEQNGGILAFKSVYGKGTTFTLTWPSIVK